MVVMLGARSEHVLKGKIVVVVDDSIVRGTTARQLVGLIYAAGAKEVATPRRAAPVSHAAASISLKGSQRCTATLTYTQPVGPHWCGGGVGCGCARR
jgi:hypothetical protein